MTAAMAWQARKQRAHLLHWRRQEDQMPYFLDPHGFMLEVVCHNAEQT